MTYHNTCSPKKWSRNATNRQIVETHHRCVSSLKLNWTRVRLQHPSNVSRPVRNHCHHICKHRFVHISTFFSLLCRLISKKGKNRANFNFAPSDANAREINCLLCVFCCYQVDNSYQMMLERQHQLEQMHRQHQLQQQSRRSPMHVQGRTTRAMSPTQHIKNDMSSRQKPSNSDDTMAKRQLCKCSSLFQNFR